MFFPSEMHFTVLKFICLNEISFKYVADQGDWAECQMPGAQKRQEEKRIELGLSAFIYVSNNDLSSF